MTNPTTDTNDLKLSLPITEEAHAIAHHLARYQPNARKAEQVKLNSLAVSAVDTYLQMMRIQTDITASDSHNPSVCLGSDVADLIVTDLGRLECRPIKNNHASCYVPIEVWQDRIGYVAVQLDEALEEAVLVGFTPSVQTENVPLYQFQPLQTLLQRLDELKPLPASSEMSVQTTETNLGELLQGLLMTGWQTLEELLLGNGENLAYRRARRSDAESEREGASSNRRMGKLISLERLEERQVILLAGSNASYFTKTSASDSVSQDVEITIRIIPANRQKALPTGLQLIILNESGTIEKQVEAKPGNDYLRVPISGKRGERFRVRVVLVDSSWTEYFVI